ncbi:MAG: orotidine-5'-phosphate decarboxylase [Actinomycetes bacterium]|jgi:orotidine-5'-phosphate decarboxylase|nr:orotidine-5'-phosphate decarboxylase [Actinomycetes bacterium]
MDAAERIIVALDGSPVEARNWARRLSGTARWVKIGMTLFDITGPSIVPEMHDLGFKVFLDLKLHDIPFQVEHAAEHLASLGVDLLTVHAFGGRSMMGAAVEGSRRGAEAEDKPAPHVLAVTVLTSANEGTMASIGINRPIIEQVELLARLAREACVHGVVCSPFEASMVRSILGTGADIVTPGVRPAGASADDQSRVATPAQALQNGATQLVIGRPITQAADPVAAFQAILDEIA